jgi:hypothetical protein
MVANAEPGSESVRNRFIMRVSQCYASIVIKHRLSPKQLWTELDGTIITNGDEDACTPLINWIVLAVTHQTASIPSTDMICCFSSSPTWTQLAPLVISAPPECRLPGQDDG